MKTVLRSIVIINHFIRISAVIIFSLKCFKMSFAKSGPAAARPAFFVNFESANGSERQRPLQRRNVDHLFEYLFEGFSAEKEMDWTLFYILKRGPDDRRKLANLNITFDLFPRKPSLDV